MLNLSRLVSLALLGLGAYGGYQYSQIGEFDIMRMLEGIPTNTLIIAAVVGAIIFSGRSRQNGTSAQEARIAQMRAEGASETAIEARLSLDRLRPKEGWLNRFLIGAVPLQIFHQCYYAAQDGSNPLQSGLLGFGYALIAVTFANLCVVEAKMSSARESLPS